ncbi:unnamed protein product [Lactuca saligna]|uniref:Transcription factor IIIC 90kDa subunit N-terminal domain-containing protein n=1 Tax=Lactuca saligna TaxID=75948 RepID=A0AA35ZIB6_LACSI|nr:unnamed protein product [Lactuca saligna]
MPRHVFTAVSHLLPIGRRSSQPTAAPATFDPTKISLSRFKDQNSCFSCNQYSVMASRFQAVALVASPTYPNAISWSNENLVAVASGHLVTILNPAMPSGPKGLITIPTSKPFSFGVIERKDLLSGCMLPICLSRDIRPCVRSISWSPLGLAPNSGCLLAVCTTEGVVKVYHSPFREFSSEWVEVLDVSEMLHTYFEKIRYEAKTEDKIY